MNWVIIYIAFVANGFGAVLFKTDESGTFTATASGKLVGRTPSEKLFEALGGLGVPAEVRKVRIYVVDAADEYTDLTQHLNESKTLVMGRQPAYIKAVDADLSQWPIADAVHLAASVR